MDEHYDVVIMGTGLKECILSGILATEGKKILQIDRNPYYGGDSASLALSELYKQFNKEEKIKANLRKDYAIDLIPKFLMSSELLVSILVKTGVASYLEFKSIDGSYIVHNGKIHKIPSTVKEASESPLMGWFEKMRCAKFLKYVHNWDPNKPETHKGYNLNTMTISDLFSKFSLKPDTIDFIGHGMALQSNDAYLKKPALPIVQAIKTYSDSVGRYGDSPYIYPLYGLGDLPQAFARLSAVYGGTYMLNAEYKGVDYGADGRVHSVKIGDEPAVTCDYIIADPNYFPDKVQKTDKVIRAICICTAPIKDIGSATSAQIILSQKELNANRDQKDSKPKRANDIYIGMVSSTHMIAPAGKYICIISTIVETSTPELEIEPAFKFLGPIEDKFVSISDVLVPTTSGKDDGIFISKSYDPETHFGDTCKDILDMYQRITGKPYNLS